MGAHTRHLTWAEQRRVVHAFGYPINSGVCWSSVGLYPTRVRAPLSSPGAIRIAQELKQGGRNETYSYTTFSWLVSLFFSCPPNATGVHTHGTGPRTTLHCPNETYKAQVGAHPSLGPCPATMHSSPAAHRRQQQKQVRTSRRVPWQ